MDWQGPMEANKERRSARTDRRVAAVRSEDAVPQVAEEVATEVPGDDDDVMMMTRIGQGARVHVGAGLRVVCARPCAGDGGLTPQDPGTFPPYDTSPKQLPNFSPSFSAAKLPFQKKNRP